MNATHHILARSGAGQNSAGAEPSFGFDQAGNALLEGGIHRSIMQAAGDGSTAYLGEILGLRGDFHSIFHEVVNRVDHGFETLLVDIQSEVCLDDLLWSIDLMRDGAMHEVRSLVITSSRHASAGVWLRDFCESAADCGVYIENVQGVFDHFVIEDHENNLLHVYLQTAPA